MSHSIKIGVAAALSLCLIVPTHAQDGHARRAREMAKERERAKEAREREARTRAHVEAPKHQGQQPYFAGGQTIPPAQLKRAAEAAQGAARSGTVQSGSMHGGTTVAPGNTPRRNEGGGGSGPGRAKKPGQ